MRPGEKDEIQLNKFIDLIKIPQFRGDPFIINQPRVVDHREFEKIDGKGWLCTFIFLLSFASANF